jgi:hypothetical protein
VTNQRSPPGKSEISNEAGRCQEDSSSFYTSLNLFSSPPSTPMRMRSDALSLDGFFPSSIVIRVHPTRSNPCRFIIAVLPTNHLFGHCRP